MPRRKLQPPTRNIRQPPSKILVPVRYSAWLTGDLGRTLEATLKKSLNREDATVTRLPRGFVVEAPEAPGVLLETVHRATLELEAAVRAAYAAMHLQMGPVWTGTLQVVFDVPEASPLPVVSPSAEPVAA